MHVQGAESKSSICSPFCAKGQWDVLGKMLCIKTNSGNIVIVQGHIFAT